MSGEALKSLCNPNNSKNIKGHLSIVQPQQGHTDMLASLRFTLAFAHCVMEVAAAKDSGTERCETLDASFLEQSLVADQISQLSREWR